MGRRALLLHLGAEMLESNQRGVQRVRGIRAGRQHQVGVAEEPGDGLPDGIDRVGHIADLADGRTEPGDLHLDRRLEFLSLCRFEPFAHQDGHSHGTEGQHLDDAVDTGAHALNVAKARLRDDERGDHDGGPVPQHARAGAE